MFKKISTLAVLFLISCSQTPKDTQWQRTADSGGSDTQATETSEVDTTKNKDKDEDGFSSQADGGTDCDDQDKQVNPHATEKCDGIDNDCDHQVDETGAIGESTWYHDKDGDNHGTASDQKNACDQPAGYTAASDDCNDSVSSTYPGAAETCDNVDNNCSGLKDESGCSCITKWNGSTPYQFCTSATDWSTAVSRCYNDGYHLATIDSVDEDNWFDQTWFQIAGVLSTAHWIGYYLNTSYQWTWVYSSSSGYTNWGPNEPQGYGSCTAVNSRWDYHLWDDEDCHNQLPYVCEGTP